jgi:predicted small metal-binding protein
VARIIRCECGFVAHGDNDAMAIAAIRDHMSTDHPALLETVTEEDLRGLIHIE